MIKNKRGTSPDQAAPRNIPTVNFTPTARRLHLIDAGTLAELIFLAALFGLIAWRWA